jgi:hypothetical protein
MKLISNITDVATRSGCLRSTDRGAAEGALGNWSAITAATCWEKFVCEPLRSSPLTKRRAFVTVDCLARDAASARRVRMATTTLNENITLKGLDNINVTETFDIKPIEIKPIDITNKNELTVTKPIELKTDSKSDMKSDSKSDAKSKLDLLIEPLTIDQRTALDVKPLVIDTCQTSTTKLAPLPPTAIDQPYHHHFGITYMGMELWGFNLNGRSGTVVESPPHRHSFVSIPARRTEPCPEPDPCGESPRRGLRVRVAGQMDDRG